MQFEAISSMVNDIMRWFIFHSICSLVGVDKLTSLPALASSPCGPRGPSGPVEPGGPGTGTGLGSGWMEKRQHSRWVHAKDWRPLWGEWRNVLLQPEFDCATKVTKHRGNQATEHWSRLFDPKTPRKKKVEKINTSALAYIWRSKRNKKHVELVK